MGSLLGMMSLAACLALTFQHAWRMRMLGWLLCEALSYGMLCGHATRVWRGVPRCALSPACCWPGSRWVSLPRACASCNHVFRFARWSSCEHMIALAVVWAGLYSCLAHGRALCGFWALVLWSVPPGV